MDLPSPSLPPPDSESPPTPAPLPTEYGPPALQPLMQTCACCGSPALPEEMVQIGDAWVMEAHKDRWVEALRQGANPRQNHSPLDALELKFGKLLAATWHLTRLHLVPFLVLHSVFWLPLTLLEGWWEANMISGDEIRQVGASSRLHHSLDALIGSIPTAAMLLLCSATFRGRRLSGWSALNEALKVWPRMIGANILRGLGLVLGLILLVVPGVLFYARSVLVPCCIVEGGTVAGSFEDSLSLSKGHFWRTAGYYTLLSLVLCTPLMVALFSVAIVTPEDGGPWLLSSLVEFVFSIPLLLLTPFTFVFYQALRDRQ